MESVRTLNPSDASRLVVHQASTTAYIDISQLTIVV